MSTSEILELVRAGYTKAEIDALTNPRNHETEPAQDHETEPAQDHETEPAQERRTADNPAMTLIRGLSEQIKTLTDAIQASNIRGADSKIQTPDDVETILLGLFEEDK